MGELSGELAESLRDNLPQELANPDLRNDGKLKALKLTAGFSWYKETLGKVLAPYLSAAPQRAFRNPGTKQLAAHPRAKLRAIWFALHSEQREIRIDGET